MNERIHNVPACRRVFFPSETAQSGRWLSLFVLLVKQEVEIHAAYR